MHNKHILQSWGSSSKALEIAPPRIQETSLEARRIWCLSVMIPREFPCGVRFQQQIERPKQHIFSMVDYSLHERRCIQDVLEEQRRHTSPHSSAPCPSSHHPGPSLTTPTSITAVRLALSPALSIQGLRARDRPFFQLQPASRFLASGGS